MLDPPFQRRPTLTDLGAANETGLIAIDQSLDLAAGVRDELVETFQFGLHDVRTPKRVAAPLLLPGLGHELRGFQQRGDLLPDQAVEGQGHTPGESGIAWTSRR